MNQMKNFMNQIKSDITEYQEKYTETISKINQDGWAFNFWILDKFFYVDELDIERHIIDYSDFGIDCFYYYEETKELYLIQNKYFTSNNSTVTGNYLNDDVFSRSIQLLKNNTYRRSPELQQIYNANKSNPEFKVYIEIYVTNNNKDKSASIAVENFNKQQPENINAKIFYLDDIYSKYYEEDIKDHKKFDYVLKKINKETTLIINPSTLKLKSKIKTIYMIISIIDIYEMIKSAKNNKYNLVKNNVRDYIGKKTSFNKGIEDTLNNDDELSNFLYYNNGITIICDSISNSGLVEGKKYELKNPQIVNGCQTANTIFEVLNMIGDFNEIRKKYSHCYIMTKILIIDTDAKRELYKNIVTYNNSQNAIQKKHFEAVKPRFQRLKNVYKQKGFLLCISPSDEYQFSQEFPTATSLITKSEKYRKLFELDFRKTKDFYIKLDKFLQVILAYTCGAYNAYQKKSSLLKVDSSLYQTVCDFILNESINVDLLLLYLLYEKAEKAKSLTDTRRFPVLYFLIEGFAKFECQNKSLSISSVLTDSKKIDTIIKIYTEVSERYYEYFKEKYKDTGLDGYNDLTKKEIEPKKFEEIYYNVKMKYESED